jgi:hypothetical protein
MKVMWGTNEDRIWEHSTCFSESATENCRMQGSEVEAVTTASRTKQWASCDACGQSECSFSILVRKIIIFLDYKT